MKNFSFNYAGSTVIPLNGRKPLLRAALGLILGAVLLCCLFTGCVNVPTTVIKGSIAGEPFELHTPKDSKVNGLSITHHGGAFTNWTQIKIESLEAHMNPEVITTTADGQVKLIQAAGELGAKAAGAAAAGAAGKPPL